MMRAAVVVFPGSNCDRDTQHVLADVVGVPDLMRGPVNRLTALVLEGLRRALDAPQASMAGGGKPAE